MPTLSNFLSKISKTAHVTVLICLELAVMVASVLGADTANADKILGLTQSKPAAGRFVKTDRGYMIPYTEQLPGTKLKFEMVPVPGGIFDYVVPASKGKGSDPVTLKVGIKPFWIGKHEVTFAEFEIYMRLNIVLGDREVRRELKARQVDPLVVVSAATELYDPSIMREFGGGPRKPAVGMKLYAAQQYTKLVSLMTKRQYRVPFATEWEYACRAGSKTTYHFGNDEKHLDDYAWTYDNSNESLQDVGLKKPNRWGIHDMHGNVAELCMDQHDPEWLRKQDTNSLWTPREIYGTSTRAYPRVVKGGHLDSDPEDCTSSCVLPTDDEEWTMEDADIPRSPWWYTTYPATVVGFRVVRSLDYLPAKEMEFHWAPVHKDIAKDLKTKYEDGRGATGPITKRVLNELTPLFAK